MNGWKETLQENAIQPLQQFRYTVGKNATDSAMIIDAMDILYSGVVDGFCIVSSDSDYTRLATRIREKGFFVMGIGQQKTPKSFTNGCDLFVFTENLAPQIKPCGTKSKTPLPAAVSLPVEDALPLLKKAFELSIQEDGWAYLSSVGNALRSLDPSFDQRSYGCFSLKAMISKLPGSFDLRENQMESGNQIVLIRYK